MARLTHLLCLALMIIASRCRSDASHRPHWSKKRKTEQKFCHTVFSKEQGKVLWRNPSHLQEEGRCFKVVFLNKWLNRDISDTSISNVWWLLCSQLSLLPGLDVKSRKNKAVEEWPQGLTLWTSHSMLRSSQVEGSKKAGGTRATFGLTWVRD